MFQFATWDGESLAADFLAESDNKPPSVGFQSTPLEKVWSLHSPGSGVTALFRASTLQRMVKQFLSDLPLAEGLLLQPLAPGEMLDSAMQTVSLSPSMPGWQLAISTTDAPLDGNDSERIALFAWTALAVIAATLCSLGWSFKRGASKCVLPSSRTIWWPRFRTN